MKKFGIFSDDIHNIWGRQFHQYRIKQLREIFVNDLKINKNSKILDIGCGSCIFKDFLSPEECPNITAFDITPKISKTHPIHFFIDDAQNPSVNDQFDILYAGEIIEHLRDPVNAFHNWDKFLKPGGFFVLSTPNGMYPDQFHEHISLLKIKQVRSLFDRHHYTIIKILGNDLFLPFFNVFTRPLWAAPKLLNKMYEFKFSLPQHHIFFAKNLVYIAKKNTLE